jgi:hypothetical protein
MKNVLQHVFSHSVAFLTVYGFVAAFLNAYGYEKRSDAPA